MGKVNSHNTGKIWEKIKHSKVMDFTTILGKAEIHTIPKIWEKWISIVREKYGKTQTFQSNGFLEYFGWSRNPYNFQNTGKMNLRSRGKVREKTEISHSLHYLINLELMRTHGIPNACECTNPHKMEIFCGKPYHFQAVGFWGNQKLLWNPNNSQSMGNVKFHTMGISWGKLIYSHTMGFE